MTEAVPAEAMSFAVMAAVSCVLLTRVVVLPEPFQRTTESEIYPVPVTVKVKAAPPAEAVDGEIELTVGTGLFVGGGV